MTLVAGEYRGTVTDSKHRNGTETLELTQSGSDVGGSVSQNFRTIPLIRGAVALELSGMSLGGNQLLTTSPPCTFSVKAKYNTTDAVISGSYAAISGCKNQTGAFKLTEKCIATQRLPATADVKRPAVVNIKPC